MSIWKQFYKQSLTERLNRLVNGRYLNEKTATWLANNQSLPLEIADHMSENVIGTYGLPFGVALNFMINQKDYLIPMVIEEPSVIAAASYGAKLVRKNGGFTAHVSKRLMTGEIALLNVQTQNEANELTTWINAQKNDLLDVARSAHPSIVKRGGGPIDIRTHYYPQTEQTAAFFVLYLTVDTKEAMGANMMNTMLEAIDHYLNHYFHEHNLPYETLLAILSNYTTDCLVTVSTTISADTLTKQHLSGQWVAKRIALASQFAKTDTYRAATHNKGMMNGIDAIVLATGNDWRAIEASIHAYATKTGQYQGLTTWTYDETNQRLHGELTIPMPIGTVGGSIGIHPSAKLAHQLLGHPDAKTLMTIIASVGLAQNFAALRALVSEGIKTGHMRLQAKSLAIQVGAQSDEVESVTEKLLQQPQLNQETAKQVLLNWRNNHSTHN